MTAPEVQLQKDLEYFQKKSSQLDERDQQIRQILAVFDGREQRLSDSVLLACDRVTRARAHHKLRELRELRKEIESILTAGR